MSSRTESSSIAGIVIFSVLLVGTVIVIVALTKVPEVPEENRSWRIAGLVFASLIAVGAFSGLVVSAVGEARLQKLSSQAISSASNWWNSVSPTMP